MPVETMTHSAVLRPQEVAHVELLIEQVLRAASADDIVVNAELP